ncbi:MAG: peptidylprolyl isomerase [Bacteroidaceae bacterium]|nr:peptidylprolyl isomerase [Bacteroidaceae bacterium]MBR5148989.1 peptidylprolyl isomerase [Bacteroidaceae bacterium]
MKKLISLLCALMALQTVGAQTADPVVMTVNGVDVTRSEFEYSFNKNNTDLVVDKKSLDEYVELFVNYKLKVAAALDAQLDTMETFKKEVADYRSQQAEEYLVDNDFIEKEARNTYQQTAERIGPDGQFKAAHILIRLTQQATPKEQAQAKVRIDSIYAALKGGADFAELAKTLSEDPGTAREGGMLPWLTRGQLLKEFEVAALALQPGEMSAPVLSPVGYHIIYMSERKPFEPYEFHRASIIQFLEQRGIRAHAKRMMGQKLAAQMGNVTPEEALAKAELELDAQYPEFGFLMKEFYEGSLLYEISTREVWNKAAEDTEGLEKYFKKNKKNYNYEEPVYRGLVVHCVSDDVLKKVQKLVKKQPQKEWVKVIREAFNSDSLIQVKMVRGPFKATQNVFADYYAFEQGERPDTVPGFPVTSVIGKMQKKGPDSYEDVRGPVTADYQNHLEQLWVKELRKRYAVTLYPEALETVNKH